MYIILALNMLDHDDACTMEFCIINIIYQKYIHLYISNLINSSSSSSNKSNISISM